MRKHGGLKVKSIAQGSFFYISGLRKSDIITSVNGTTIEDELDFRFFSAVPHIKLSFLRNGKKRDICAERSEGSFIDIDFYEKPINRCCNRCIFCFIDQMPPGLRRGLYIKDEDVKHSFINGNYVTLSSLTDNDLEKVARLGISPLYISVHATDPGVRNQMLGNKKAPPIMPQLRFLHDSGIQLHTQVVLCPGYNDGNVLRKTLGDLFSIGDSLRSIAVVPVGVTRFRKSALREVDTGSAVTICATVYELSDQMTLRDGFRKLFCADELFLRAGLPLPPRRYYEDYPQIENGVGLIRMLLEDWKRYKRQIKSGKQKVLNKKPVLVVSSVSAFPYIEKISKEAMGLFEGLLVEVVPVINNFFGSSVTVAGLLTARDVIPVLKKNRGKYKRVFLPSVMFNYAGSTLDGYSVERIENVSGITIKAAESIGEVFSTEW